MIRFTYLDSPVGRLLIAGDQEGLREIVFERGGRPAPPRDGWAHDDRSLSAVVDQLRAYFAKELRAFDVPLAPVGTPFQKAVWSALCSIPYGETRRYRDIAGQIGRPSACRAVGAANGANPIPIIVPCHRVVGSDGSLTGFGGGLTAKEYLLRLEGAFRPLPAQLSLV